MTQDQAFGAMTSTDRQNNDDWWPETLNLKILHQHHPASDPTRGADYRTQLQALDFDALVADVDALMTDSQDWWPADFGHYGGLMIRLTWHAAGTYRVTDGRGGANAGAQRFAPLNSWPDNGNLDKARRLLWPIKAKYGNKISWADLLVLAGNRALETMGFKTFGFAYGRPDIYAPEDDVYWGPEDEWLADERYKGTFENGDRELMGDLAAVQMGLIYVNPEGPNGVPDAMKSAHDIRETFGRMAMNDEETVALVVGGHTFGKMHGAGPEPAVAREPEGAPIAQQGLGWKNSHGTGKGADTTTSGFEGAWTPTPTQWDNKYLETIFSHEWELVESPAGHQQWQPKEVKDGFMVPPVQPGAPETPPTMSTADMALITDPAYLEISKRFYENPDQLADAFARAWFKLLHRDMGPKIRYCGPDAPDEEMIWQDNVPAGKVLSDAEITTLKRAIADSGLSAADLVGTAWASASTFRKTDFRGGANGAHIALSPQTEWDANVRIGVPSVLSKLTEIKDASGTGASLADTIVLAGNVGIEMAAAAAGFQVVVPFTPGRGDATQEMTEIDSFQYLEPKADGFRNYEGKLAGIPAEHMLVERAFQLGLSAPEMTALVGGLRVIGVNAEDGKGQFTDRVGQLTNDFFVNLLDMSVEWSPVGEDETSFEGRDRNSGDVRWTATRADLIFGSNSQLRAIAEVFGASDGEEQMLDTFIDAWVKVMENDRFDLE